MTIRELFKKSYVLILTVRWLRDFMGARRRHQISNSYGFVAFHSRNKLSDELKSRDLLRRAENNTPWLRRVIYPAGGASGTLLTYLLLRILNELKIQNICEFGAGQSTRIISDYCIWAGGESLTIEHDQWWAEKLRSENIADRSSVEVLPLEPATCEGRNTLFYKNCPQLIGERRFALLLVDGPPGTREFSRLGAVASIPEHLEQEWLVVWDDLERPGDLESFGLAIGKLRRLGVAHEHILFEGDRTVGLIFTSLYRNVRYFF